MVMMRRAKVVVSIGHDRDMENVWSDPVAALKWIKKPNKVGEGWDMSNARLNLCYNALDRHVIDGRADDDALMYESTVTGKKARFTSAELLDEVARAAGVLAALGVEQGQSVILCMPAIPELAVSMLACMRLGVAFDVVSPDITAGQIAARINEMKPVVVISSSSSTERSAASPIDDALAASEHHVGYRVVIQTGSVRPHLSDTDFEWEQVMKPGAVQSAGCASVDADAPVFYSVKEAQSLTAGEMIELICTNNGLMPPENGDICLLHAVSSTPSALVIPLLEHLMSGAPVVLVEGHEGGVKEVTRLGSAYKATTVIPC